MPGGRLTDEDRSRIAAGLGDGLGYAEIARRLDRPTSTVSREVGRNGGPGNYRAERARALTRRRAQRRGPVAPAPAPPADVHGRRDPAAVRAFVDQFSARMAETGLSRMASRVLVCLFATDSGTLTAAELARDLRVSPASVSKAVGYLEELALVRREREVRGRRERYTVEDDLWTRSWRASARKQVTWADAARQGVEILGATTPAGARLDDMSQFFDQLARDMTGDFGGAAIDDALTVLAASMHVTSRLTPEYLATALGWPRERVVNALREAGSDRLTRTQREALDPLRANDVRGPGGSATVAG
jgi:DNA-binding transcriptional regulator GbsR (MarR family)